MVRFQIQAPMLVNYGPGQDYLLLDFASHPPGRKNTQEADRDATNQGVEV